MAELPNPQRQRHPDNPAETLPKIFIAYPHKPTLYTQIAPPVVESGASEEELSELWRQYEERVIQHERDAEAEIREHEETVKRFADFLQQSSIAVAYDLLVRDTGVGNITRWCQAQMEDSDYVILLVTPSFCSFLKGEGPQEKEPLFSSDYLYNLIHFPPQTLQIIPVFLCRPKNLSLLPKALVASSVYEVWENYRPPFDGDLEALYCRLTKQNRYEPPVPMTRPFKIQSRRKRFGQGVVSMDTTNTALSSSLSQNHTPLNTRTLAKLSEESSFSAHWKTIASHLGLSEADIERCEGRGGSDQSEMCLQMLRHCGERRGRQALTVAELAVAITRSGLPALLSSLNSVISTS